MIVSETICGIIGSGHARCVDVDIEWVPSRCCGRGGVGNVNVEGRRDCAGIRRRRRRHIQPKQIRRRLIILEEQTFEVILDPMDFGVCFDVASSTACGFDGMIGCEDALDVIGSCCATEHLLRLPLFQLKLVPDIQHPKVFFVEELKVRCHL